ncbi:hypothetical protein Ple7327_3061 [Pleurocapsa sp. PCC 7327]|uniref:hypothetical protein n=1 Tax=Pleurocapsa sp. PCC 7327 TaxID=118163 RepID=UPI00029FEBA4|nr:hypothetical protein [Pleurocapsa sp. PCC 7327]AFY78292.1 hypothetical protein Ple7327_3061 [Pleurocapsa sp. PCC 7327]
MSQWQEIGYGLEAKLTENNSIWVRNQGQQSEHPHLIVTINNQNNITGVQPSDNQATMGSIEGTLLILSQVKDKLLKIQTVN